jgi:type II secretory pathway component HofQ
MGATMPLRQQNRYQPKQACLMDHDALGHKQPRSVRKKSAPRWLWHLSILWIALSVGYLAGVARASEEVVQIRIVHRDANDMLTIVQPLISQYGFISADTASNSLIVIDQPANVRRVQQLVSQIDQPVPQLKIRVQYGRQETSTDQSVATRGKIEVGDATVAVGNKKKEGIDVELSADESQRQDQGEYTVIVRSGSTAYISSGYDVPYPERWARLSHKHGHIQRPVTFKKVDTGYDVRPVLMGNNVQIEITPHISYINPRGLRQPIRFAEAATRLNVPLDQWVEIAGTSASTQEINRQILGGGRASSDSQLSMRLMVTRH